MSLFLGYVNGGHMKRRPPHQVFHRRCVMAHWRRLSAEETNSSIDDRLRGVRVLISGNISGASPDTFHPD